MNDAPTEAALATGAAALLDHPVWASLSSHHASLSIGGLLARRYARDVNLFAAAGDDSAAASAALAGLVQPGEAVYMLQVPRIVVPAGLAVVKSAAGVQLLATRPVAGSDETADIVDLTEADAPQMLALAQLTEPGPFLARTHTMGHFLGIRMGGRLAAMAGERFRFAGHTEISGVCTHPDFRGRGLARRLSAAVAVRIAARGHRPFLHAWQANQPAIALYQSLGFAIRTEVHVSVLGRIE